MTTGIWILLIVLFAGGLFGTMFAFRQEEKKMRRYEEEGDTIEDELRRSHEYETASLKSNVPLLSSIYIVTFVAAIVAFIVYLK